MIVRQKRETRDVEWPDSGKTSNVKWNLFKHSCKIYEDGPGFVTIFM